MTTAYVYTRFSPRRKADESESCETQQAYCEQYAHDNAHVIVKSFEDRGISGAEEDRPGLWSAINSLTQGSILLVYKLDRLARDVYLSECIRRAVDKAGARIIAVEGDIVGDGPEQVMIRQVLAAFAEYERKIIAIRTKYAMRHHQKNGRRMSRYAPYGQKIDKADTRRLLRCEREQQAITVIEELHMSDPPKSVHEIVVKLNADLPELARGDRWRQRDVKRILEKL